MAKTETIIIRVDKEMKDEMLKIAQEDRRELSDFLRLMIEDLIKDRKKKK